MHEINEWLKNFTELLKLNQFSTSQNSSEFNIYKLHSFLKWLRIQYENAHIVFTVEELHSAFMSVLPVTLPLSRAGFSRYVSRLESMGILNNIKHGRYKITAAIITFEELINQFIKQSQLHLLAMKLTYQAPSDLLSILTPKHVKINYRKNFIFTLLQEIIDSAKKNVFMAFKKEILCSSNEVAKALLRKYREGVDVSIIITNYRNSIVKIKENIIFNKQINSAQECLKAYLNYKLKAELVELRDEIQYPINILIRDNDIFFTFNHFQFNLNPDNYLIEVISQHAKNVIKKYYFIIINSLKNT